MKILLPFLALLISAPAHALSPLEDNVQGTMLPQVVDAKVAPYYNQLSTEQRNCNGAPPKAIRVIHEGDMMTMDFSETRLNIELDKQDKIKRAFCG